MIREVLANIGRGPQITFAKRSVLRRESPFELDLDIYGESDYERIIPQLREVERRLRIAPPDGQGLRWIHLPEAVLFYGERTLDLFYDDFVSRVNISHVGEFYRDSLSTATRRQKRQLLAGWGFRRVHTSRARRSRNNGQD